MAPRVPRAEVTSLLRRCLRAARRCPAFADREFMRVYTVNRFRESTQERDPARVRRLLAHGLEEVERMEMLHAAVAGRQRHAAGSAPASPAPTSSAPTSSAREAGGAQVSTPQADPLSWDTAAVGSWLDRVGLGAHRAAFESRAVSGRLLLELDDEDLSSELQVSSRLERKRILAELRPLRPPPQT
ncbi:hypothetical protein T492DRAFT_1023092 [Pavlovales sp. CCMP2436]|nr:hypothetical protein T492DRAFT_1023092 [Pavlovales sp. CCMP2436]|mmetsp:Transcript_45094/g.111806  ORF Transcript_45094/g.111806 Transcript_45094/m.111806 type:complete len:186 (-) Transcript_45094:175-732(-)